MFRSPLRAVMRETTERPSDGKWGPDAPHGSGLLILNGKYLTLNGKYLMLENA